MRPRLDTHTMFLGLSLLAVLGACGAPEGQGSGQTVAVVDSGGIEIVSNATHAWGPGEAWRVADAPSLTIGTADGDAAYTLYGVRAAIRLEDGRIAIANQGLRQVKIYDPDGRHLQDFGREGEGPGEFMLLMDLWRAPGDSIVAADNRLARLTVFDRAGRVGRVISLQQGETPRQLFGRRTLDDGSLLVSGAVRATEPPRVGLFDGGTREFDRYAADGSRLNPIGALPQGLNWGYDTGNPYGPSYTAAPFSIFSPPHATDGVSVFLGDGTLAEVLQWSPDGRLLRVVRWAAEPRPVTPELQEGYRQIRTESADTPEYRRTVQQSMEGIVFPDHLPVYETLRTDSEDHLWVKPYAPQWEVSGSWWVFDPTGRWLGEVQIPEGLNVLDIGRDDILGVVRDDQDVERVVAYRLDRS